MPIPTARNIEVALRLAGASAPGLDGVPYEAYRNFKESLLVLQSALQSLMLNPNPDFLPPDFNHSRLICLPKKPAGTDPHLGGILFPGDHETTIYCRH